ncbi:MAG: hypothetical protein KAV87_49940 [Desulfobacteraceae bacterium]|nr:hypothetical protein [Desulfobacteraceae bacterium]
MIESYKYIATIRKSEEREWPDTRTISGLVEVSKDYADQEDKDCGPHWVKTNPVVRFATIEIREIT